MKRMFILLLSVWALVMLPSLSAAELAASSAPSVQDRIAKETNDFNPEKVGQQLEGKAGEIMGMAKGGSYFYVAIALCLFVILLIVGLFYRPLLKAAFLILILAILAFLLIQNWEAVLDGIKGFFHWLGSEAKPTVPAQEGTALKGSPV